MVVRAIHPGLQQGGRLGLEVRLKKHLWKYSLARIKVPLSVIDVKVLTI
jgi:hypothetical protein